MKAAWITAVALVLPMLGASGAQAQWNVARFGSEPNRVYTAFGLDPALVTTAGYSRVVALAGHPVQFSGDAGVGAAKMDARDFRVRFQVYTTLVRWRSLYLNGSATSNTRGTENSIYRGINFGADFTATAGVYRSRWFAAADFGFDKAVITHVKHSDWYRQVFYPEARDGWYLDAGGTYHYGIATGWTLGRTEVLARAGLQRTEKFDDLLPPAYGTLAVGLAF